MKFQNTLHLLALAAATSFAEATEKILAEQKEQNLRRKLKENAVSTVERFLWLIQSDKKETKDGGVAESIQVKWDGRKLTPMLEHEKMREKHVLMSNRKLSEAQEYLLELPETEASFETKGMGIDDIILVTKKDDSGRRKTRRRRRTGRRKIKASSGKEKEPKSCKKGTKDGELEVIRKKTKGSESEDGGYEETLCFRGSAENVTAACEMYNADCCQGYLACSYWRNEENNPSTVCQGSCNGDLACLGFAQGAYIAENSCVGYQACRLSNRQATSDCEPFNVGQDSCVGERACSFICLNAPNCTVDIGDNSCVSDYGACDSISRNIPAVQSIQIGSYACTSGGRVACGSFGSRSPANVHVDDYACNGDGSCFRFARDATGELLQVGASSCDGPKACAYFGYESTSKEVAIQADACYGEQACQTIGRRSSNLVVEEGSCAAVQSCFIAGYFATGDVTIKQDACLDFRSCIVAGAGFASGGLKPTSLYIGKGACLMDRACQALGRNVSGHVYIGKNACAMNANQCDAYTVPICRMTPFVPEDGTYCPGP